jgi:hypothetical protein
MDFPRLVPRPGQDPLTGKVDFWPDDSWSLGEQTQTNYTTSVMRWCKAAYEEATFDNDQREEGGKLQKYIDYLMGKQWSGRQPSYKAKPVDNRIARLFWELVSLLTDIRPIFDFRPSNEEFKKQSEILNKTTRSWWMWSDADQTLAYIVIYALLDVGYAKLDWDQSLRNGEGDFDLIACGPNDVLLLKPRAKLQQAQALIYQTVQPLGWFRDRYKLRGELVQASEEFSTYTRKPSAPSHLAQYVFDSLSPAFKRKLGTPGTTQTSAAPMALYREFWLHDATCNTSDKIVKMGKPGKKWSYEVAPGNPLYPRGRLIVMGGDDDNPVILEDGPNPWLHGEYPFAALKFNSVPWQWGGISELRNWIPLQDIVNLLLAGTLNVLKKIVNPPLIYPRNAFDEATSNDLDPSMPGLKLAWNQQAGSAPSYGPTPVLPPIVLSVLQAVGKELEITSGVAAVNQALSKKQVPGEGTLEKIQASQQTPVRMKGRALEVFLRDLGKQQVFNLFQMYDKKRRVMMLGQKAGTTKEDFDWDPGTMVPAGVDPADHAKAFFFNIQPGTLLNIDRQGREQKIFNLRKGGDISRRAMYNELELGLDVDQIEKELMDEAMKKAKLEMMVKQVAGGGGQPQQGAQQ